MTSSLMKVLHIHAKALKTVDLSRVKDKLPKNLLLFTTVQYIDQLDIMAKQVGAKVIKPKISHTLYPGQILGCTELTPEELAGIDAILYVGDGVFHPQATANAAVDVYCYDPRNDELTKLDASYYDTLMRRKKAGLNMFYRSKDVGVLITLKSGQGRIGFLTRIKRQFPDKNFYPLIFDTLDIGKLEDFNFIECYVNTACPRIGVDDTLPKPCVNVQDISELNLIW